MPDKLLAPPPSEPLERKLPAPPPSGLLERNLLAPPPSGLLERNLLAPPPSGLLERNFRPSDGGFRWEGVELLAYKEEGSAPFKAITRQVLFAAPELACELRYFEMRAGGHSTLERHGHVHAVTIFRGRGLCLVGAEVREVAAPDLVTIPPMTWHQFRASAGEPFGFLCMVNAERDKPRLPGEEDLRELRQNPAIAAFLDGTR